MTATILRCCWRVRGGPYGSGTAGVWVGGRLSIAGRERDAVALGVHPGQLRVAVAGGDQAVAIGVNAESRAVVIGVEDQANHGQQLARECGQIVGGLQGLEGGGEEPEGG